MVARLPHRIHCVGVAGGGLRALSALLAERGHRVTGSDASLGQALRWGEVRVQGGHDAAHLGDAELVIRSAAVPEDNPELRAARAGRVPVLKYSEALGRLMAVRLGIAVAGTHGKTTTTALLAYLLREAGRDPGWVVGGLPLSLPGPAGWGGRGPLVAEACEYDLSFLNLRYRIGAITSVAPDHLDSLGDEAGVRRAFARFGSRVPAGGTLVLGPGVPAPDRSACTMGATHVLAESDVVLRALREDGDGFHGEVVGGGAFHLRQIGQHNLHNLQVALACARAAGLPPAEALPHLPSFGGVARRLQDLGEVDLPGARRVRLVDDFAHHPDELAAGLAALRSRFPGRRVVIVYQPHQVSRTEAFLPGFARELTRFDAVALCDIFVVRDAHPERAPELGRRLARLLGSRARRVGPARSAHDAVAGYLRSDDVCVVTGAGDIDGLATELAGTAAGPARR